MAASADRRPVFAVVADIIDNLHDIVRSEAQLAKAQLKEEVRAASRPAIRMFAGVVLGLYALAFFITALVLLLSRVLELWAAAGLVAVLITVIGLILFISGKRRWVSAHQKAGKTERPLREHLSWTRAASNLQPISNRRAAN